MAQLERKYIIPLRKEWLKVPIYKRTKKSIRAVREFLEQHMKTEDVRIGRYLNEAIWARGMKRPPHKVDVIAKKVEDKENNYVTVELSNAPKEEPKKETSKKSKITDKIKEAMKAPEDKEANKKAEQEKEEKKELKKELEEKEERMRAPKLHNEEQKNARFEGKKIYSHTGKSHDGVETTGRH